MAPPNGSVTVAESSSRVSTGYSDQFYEKSAPAPESASNYITRKYFSHTLPPPKPNPVIFGNPALSLAAALMRPLVSIEKGKLLALFHKHLEPELPECDIEGSLILLNGPNAKHLPDDHEKNCIMLLIQMARPYNNTAGLEDDFDRIRENVESNPLADILFDGYKKRVFEAQLEKTISSEAELLQGLQSFIGDDAEKDQETNQKLIAAFDTLISHEQFELIAKTYLALQTKNENELTELESIILRFLKSEAVNQYMQRFVYSKAPGLVTGESSPKVYSVALFQQLTPEKSAPKEKIKKAFFDQTPLYSHPERSNLDILCGNFLTSEIKTLCEMAFMLQQAQVYLHDNLIPHKKSVEWARYYIKEARKQIKNMPPHALKNKFEKNGRIPQALRNDNKIDEENVIDIAKELESFTTTACDLALLELKTPLTLNDPYAYYMQASILHAKAKEIELTTPATKTDVFKAIPKIYGILDNQLTQAIACVDHNPGLGYILKSLALYDIHYFFNIAENLQVDYQEFFKQQKGLQSKVFHQFILMNDNEKCHFKIDLMKDATENLHKAIANRAQNESSELNGLRGRGFSASRLAETYNKYSLEALLKKCEGLLENLQAHVTQKTP